MKASTVQSSVTADPSMPMRGMLPGLSASRARTPAAPIASPSTPPISESSTLSVRSWRTMRPRPAPMAAADGDLARADAGAGQQQVGDIGAGDQEHRSHRAQQDQERRPDIAHDDLLQRLHREAAVRAQAAGNLRSVFFGGEGERGLGRVEGDARFQTRGGVEEVGLLRAVGVGLERHVEIGGGSKAKPAPTTPTMVYGSPPSDRDLPITEGSEPKRRCHRPLPSTATWPPPGRSSSAQEGAAQRNGRAEEVEEFVRDVDALAPARAGRRRPD